MRRSIFRVGAALTATLASVALVAAAVTAQPERPMDIGTEGTTATTAPATTTTLQATTTTVATTTTSTLPATTTTVRPTTTTTSTSTSTSVPAATDTLRRGDTGPAVLTLQQRLRSLGYWLGTPDGTYGYLTEQAVLAFQKVEGLERDGVAGPTTRNRLAEAGRPTGRSGGGDLTEVDKARQVLLIVRNGAVAWALNTSTGTEQPYQVNGRTELADTPPGRWTVGWAVDGVDYGELGALYRPRYFHQDGIAVHGYSDVPAWPASHGCVRVTESAMDWIWAEGLLPIGSTVWVY